MPRTRILSRDDLPEAADLLRAGRLVAFPTETVYGLGADAADAEAVARVFEAKGRPSFNPLIVHVADLAAASELAEISGDALRLAREFWPGPLTLVLPSRGRVASLATAGLDTVAVRVPANPLALRLLRAAGRPVAAPSANPSGALSPTAAAHVIEGLSGRIDAVLDGGPCPVGVESTIIGFAPAPTLLRPGGLAAERAEAVAGPLAARGDRDGIDAPGQLPAHYAPSVPLRMNAARPEPGEAFLGFGGVGAGEATLSLSETGDLAEAAARLFDCLHRLDREGRPVAVAPVPETGLGLAINDRLRRACAARGSAA